MVNMTREHKIIVRHLRKSRDIGKHILEIVPAMGSAVITHKFILKTYVSERIIIKSEIEFLPNIRMYKITGNKILGDESMLNEDLEKC